MSLPDGKPRAHRAWLVFGVSVLLGPLIGGVMVTVLISLSQAVTGEFENFFGTLPEVLLLGAASGYLLGILPAFFAGMLAALWSLSETGLTLARVISCAAVGGLFGTAVGLVGMDGRAGPIFPVFMAVVSMVVASILWFVLRRWVSVEPAVKTQDLNL